MTATLHDRPVVRPTTRPATRPVRTAYDWTAAYPLLRYAVEHLTVLGRPVFEPACIDHGSGVQLRA